MYNTKCIMKTPNFKPTKNRVLLLPEELKEVTETGIILGDEADSDKVRTATVIATGPSVDQTEISVGSQALYSSYANTKIVLEGTEYVIAVDEDIYGTVE